MPSTNLLNFIGIALTILVIFIVTSNNIGNSLYTTILTEIWEKIRRAIRQTEKRQRHLEKDYYENNVRISSEHNLASGYIKKILVEQQAISDCKDKFDKELREISLFLKSKLSSPRPAAIVFQAPFYTALYCLIVVGIMTYLNLMEAGNSSKFNEVILAFTIYSIIFWLFMWGHRCFIAGFPFPDVKIDEKVVDARVEEKDYPEEKERWYSSRYYFLTQYTSIFVILGYAALWWLTIFCLSYARFTPDINLFILSTELILFGFRGFLTRDMMKDLPYLNFYGQIVVILAFAILTELLSNCYNLSIFPFKMVNTNYLNKAIFHFIFYNGFTFPILLPLVYYHLKAIKVIRPLKRAARKYKRRVNRLDRMQKRDGNGIWEQPKYTSYRLGRSLHLTGTDRLMCFLVPLLFIGPILASIIGMYLKSEDKGLLIYAFGYFILAVLMFFVCRSGFSGRLSKRIVPYLQPSDVHQSENKTSLGGEDVAEEGVEVDGTVGLGGVAQDGDDQLS